MPIDEIPLEAPDLLERLKSAFERRHRELYGYSLEDQKPVLINARAATVGLLPAAPVEPSAAGHADAPPNGERRIYMGKWLDAPVYAFEALAEGQVIDGPAIVESDTTTVLLRYGDRAVATAQRWLDISVEKI